MCSSPKGSTTRRRKVKKSEYSQSEYNEYATMVEGASAVYDRIEKEKAERRLAMSCQQSSMINRKMTQTVSIKFILIYLPELKFFFRNLIYSRYVTRSI